jgi:hypothetical protein
MTESTTIQQQQEFVDLIETELTREQAVQAVI